MLSVARDGKACSVAMGGMVTVSYTGARRPLLVGTSFGGGRQRRREVRSEGGRSYLAVEVDTAPRP